MDDILAQIRKIISEEPIAPAIVAARKPAALPVEPLKASVASEAGVGVTAPTQISATSAVIERSGDSAVMPTAQPVEAAIATPSLAIDDLSDLIEVDTPATVSPPLPPIAAMTATVVEPVAEVSAEPEPDPVVSPPDEPIATVPAVESNVAPPTAIETLAASIPSEPAPSTVDIQDSATPAIAETTAVQPPALPIVETPAPVSLSTLIANRIDPGAQRPKSGILLPTHIGRLPTAAADVAPLVSAVTPETPITVVHAPAATPLSDALGALAAGLAAVSKPAVECPEPVAPASVVVEEKAESAGPTTNPDEIIDAIRPILQDWLDANMSRVLAGALRDALPDLIARARETAARKAA